MFTFALCEPVFWSNPGWLSPIRDDSTTWCASVLSFSILFSLVPRLSRNANMRGSLGTRLPFIVIIVNTVSIPFCLWGDVRLGMRLLYSMNNQWTTPPWKKDMVCKVAAVRDVFCCTCMHWHMLDWYDMHSKKIMFLIPANFPHSPLDHASFRLKPHSF